MASKNGMISLCLALMTGSMLASAPVLAEGQTSEVAPSLEAEFKDPPNSARPRVWWHWMNGNITKQGIDEDIEWMHSVGIGGMQTFDAGLSTPQIVEKRLVYMTPAWKDAFHFAARDADSKGLELGIAASPGWSETGGPWVEPKDGLKKLVWSETEITGGTPFSGKLAAPPDTTGPYQDVPYRDSMPAAIGSAPKAPPQFYSDVAVLAVPDALAAAPLPKAFGPDGSEFDSAALTDGSLESAVAVPRGKPGQPSFITLSYSAPQKIRSATLFIAGAGGLFSGASIAPQLEASDDGKTWSKVADMPAADVPTTVSFAPVDARFFRVVFKPVPPSPGILAAAAPGALPPAFAAAGSAGTPAPIRLAKLTLSPNAKIDRFETKAGFVLVPNYYALGAPDPAAPAIDPAKVINLTGKLSPDGSLDWTPPPGKWRVLRIGASLLGTTNHPASPEATGLEVDKFDGDAVQRYLEHYLGMYKDAAGPGLLGAHGVRALLTDSIEVGAANWTPKMVADFEQLRGYDPTPWLPALTGVIIGSRAQSDRFLYDYRRTLADLMSSQHYGTVARVAHEHGLEVYGEALEAGRPSLGDDMTMRSHTDVPMSAMWTFRREDGPRPTYLADIKGAASVAHIYGQNLVAAESMTSALAYWAYAPNELRRFIDLEFVTGVNRPVIHTSVHSPSDTKLPGLSLAIFGQFFNRHESWASMARPWVDYIARSALLLQQGHNVADVGYFYGEEAPLTGLYGEHPVADAPTHNAYDFVSDDALLNQLSNSGQEIVSPGGARYRVLYLGGSSSRMTLKTLRKIAGLADGGATIVGLAPKSSPSLTDAGKQAEWSDLVARLWSGAPVTAVGKGRVIASNDIASALRTAGLASDFSFAGGSADSDIPFVHRKIAGGDIYYLVNRKDCPETIEAQFRVTGKAPELWHADSGTHEPASYRIEGGKTVVPLTLGPDESVFVVFRRAATATSAEIRKPRLAEVASLGGPWNVGFQQDRGAPASAVMSTLAPLNENADPGIKYFSGIASYRRQFTAPSGWRPGQPLILDLGSVHEVAQVFVNGNPAGTAWHAPYRVDIGPVMKPGTNQLEIKVANLWVNRLIGDAQPGAKKITWTALPTYAPDAPLRPSGLIGPVRLLMTGD